MYFVFWYQYVQKSYLEADRSSETCPKLDFELFSTVSSQIYIISTGQLVRASRRATGKERERGREKGRERERKLEIIVYYVIGFFM